MILGIDPGNNGAFVLTDGKFHFEYAFMPLKVEGKNKSIDFDLLQRHFTSEFFANVEHCFLERAVAFGMGLTGAFSYGRGFGFIEVVLRLAQIPVTQASPLTWAKEMHEGISADLKPKVKSQIAVERLFPQFKDKIPLGEKTKKMHEGVVDALLIAGYGLRKLGKA